MAEIIQLSENRRDTQDALDRLQKHFTDELVKVEQTITDHMSSAASLIPEISGHIVGAGGKRLRPLLTLSAARLSGYQGDKQIMLAAAVEFMHTATLLHDDVVDDSDMRRGKPTARKIWGNPASVLVGDFLLGQAFRMMVTTGSLAALNTLSTAAAIIAEGEVMQMAALQNVQISEDNYLQIIEAKTAALFAAAAEVGGIVANAPEAEIEALKSFGRNLGIAFQLVDDALDYGSVGQVLGKNTGADFREGKITLPFILAFHRGDDETRAFWQRIAAAESLPDKDDFNRAVEEMHRTGALRDTVARAAHYGEKARDALGLFKTGETRQLMTELVDFCIARAY